MTSTDFDKEAFAKEVSKLLHQYVKGAEHCHESHIPEFADAISDLVLRGSAEPVGWLISGFVPPLIDTVGKFNEEYKRRGHAVSPVYTPPNLPPEQLAELERLRIETCDYPARINELTEELERLKEGNMGLRKCLADQQTELTQLRAENAALKENR